MQKQNCDMFLDLVSSQAYRESKTLSEKEILCINGGKLEVVTLACGLVVGRNSLFAFTPVTVKFLISQLTNDAISYNALKYLEELIGKIPIVHIDDVCEAHIFSMENSSINGRFLCVNSYVSSYEIASYFVKNHPQFRVHKE